jgi:hypothetical protein
MRVWIILSVLVLASCTKNEPEPAAVEAADTQAPPEAEAEPASSAPSDAPPAEEGRAEWKDWGEPGVTLLTPGRAPRRTLRRTFEEGSTAKVHLEVTAVGVGGKPVGARYRVALKTKDVSNDGSKANVALRIEGANTIAKDTDPDAAANFGRLRGLRGSYTVDSLGAITNFELEAPKKANLQTEGVLVNLRRLQALLSIPLPTEEVGVGARWSLFETLEENTPMAQRTIYEITKADGSRVDVRMKVQLMNKTVDLEGVIKRLGTLGTGTGAASFDLADLTPQTAKVDTKRTLIFFKVGPGGKYNIDLHISSSLTAK